MMASYDLMGNIALVKFKRGVSKSEKNKFALDLMKRYNIVKTVLEKKDKFKGRLRTLKTNFIAGEKTLESLYRENGCDFRFNIESCYFSSRLSSERKEVAEMVKKGENVLVLFAGVAPFSIVIAKTRKPKRVVSVELGRECSKYAIINAKRNKVNDIVEVIQGDVRRVLPKMKEKFNRIVMARPNLEDDFLDVVYPRIMKGGIIHYYGFYDEEDLDKMKEMINERAKKAKRKIKIMKIKQAGDIGVKRYRYRADIKVLN
jgi:tRNA (guanine37-N1)-methyltransferase